MTGDENAYPAYASTTARKLDEGAAHHRAGRFHEAEVIYRNVLAAEPNNAEAWHLLGMIAHQAGHHETGVAFIRRALGLNPGNSTYLNNLGSIHEEAGEHAQAEACLRESIAHCPGYAPARNNLGEVFKAQGRVADALEQYRAALQIQPDFRQAENNYLMTLNYDPGITGQDLFREHLRLGERRQQLAPPATPLTNVADPGRRLRIGYLSPDFRRHAVARFFEPILIHHDRSRYEVYLYAELGYVDAVSERFRKLATGWRRTDGCDAASVAEQIRADGIDLLIDLAGHTQHNRLDVLLQRPAPILATYLGYPNTTGMNRIDYRICDEVTDPPGQSHSAERVVYLPGSFVCFQPPATSPEISPLPLLKNGVVTFGSHHPIIKLNDEVFRLWASVLAAVPRSRLLLFRHDFAPSLVRELRDRLVASGIPTDRIDIRQVKEANDAYLEIFREVDLILDCFPFTGHTMTCESLWLGVPVVTLRGDRPSARLSASVLTALGLTDLIASTPQDYVQLAVRLAGNSSRLEELRRELQPLMKARMCDGAAFTRRLEDCYRRLWQDWTRPRMPVGPPPTSVELHERGLVLVEQVNYEAAIVCFEEAVRVDPGHVLAYNSLGNALKRVGRFDDAVRAFRAGLERDPLQPALFSNLGETYKQQVRFAEAMAVYRLATLNLPPISFAYHNYLAATNYVPDWSPDAIFDEHRLWGLRAVPPQPRKRTQVPTSDRPLRLGYLSADFHEHPVARFIEPVLRHHDPAQCIVHLYGEVPLPDEVTQRIQGLVPFWRDTVGKSAEEVARRIQDDKIDILVDLTGHYSGSRLDVMALAPAPIQVTYLGYPNTSGLPTMDYWLTDAVLHPVGEPTRSVEQVVRLPGAFFCFQPPATAPLPGVSPARRTGRFTFGSHHNLQKLNEGVLALWARVLREAPESRLLMLRSSFTAPVAAWLRQRFAALGVAPERIEVRQPPSIDEHYLAVYHDIDLILDAFPFSGHTTTCESLWMGVPVMTLRGDRPSARLSAAVLTPLGLTDLIAGTPDEFVAVASRLARDPGWLADLRPGLPPRMGTVCDGAAFTCRLEAAYRQMAGNSASGGPATSVPELRRSTAPVRPAVQLRVDRTVEIIIPVRPGGSDRYPVPGVPGRIEMRVVECADGNLSRLYREAYLNSQADLVVFKHDDFCFRDWSLFEAQVWGLLARYPVIGVAGSRVFSPQRLPWWKQTAHPGAMDGLNRGMVAHRSPDGPGVDQGFLPTFYGPPGPVVVLDGAMLAVLRRWQGEKLCDRFTAEDFATWWDLDFGRHFYDMAFTFKASSAFDAATLGACCYAMVADVTHESRGGIDRAWEEAARKFVEYHGRARPLCV